MNIQELKIRPNYLYDILSGKKSFEVRKNDRDFKVGDTLLLKEWDNDFTGLEVSYLVTYILDNPEYIKEDFIVMGIEPLDRMKSKRLFEEWDIIHKENVVNG